MATAALPIGPKGHPITGHLPELRRDRLGALTRFAREYGDVVPLRMGIKRAVLLSHPDLVEDLLVTHNRAFLKTPSLRNSRRLLGNGLLTSEGDFWRRQRRLSQPAFSRERLASYGEIMLACTERAVDGWEVGEVRDVHADMMRLTMEIVARALFGADVAASADEVGDAIEISLARFNARIESMQFLVPDTWPLPGNLRFLRAATRLDRIVYGMIERRRHDAADHGDLLSLLLQARDEDGSRMTDRQLRDEVMTLFLAGHETTALALAWTWYLLATHPEVERTLHAELDAALAGRAPTVADLPRLRYAEHVVSEALRLYPPVWVISREARQPCEIGGYPIAKGQLAMASQWVVHRDPRFYDRPDDFLPERWAEPDPRRPRFAYFPFAGGPRICIGAGFAMMEAVLVLTTIARRFRLALEPGQQITPWPSVTMRPRYGVQVKLERREPSRQSAAATAAEYDA